MNFINYIKNLYIRTTGYSYTNLGRLFLRLFVGIMLLQFGIRQIANYFDICHTFPHMFGLTPEATLIIMTCVEVICPIFIMFGFLTRLMLVPPFFAMLCAEYYLLHDYVEQAAYLLSWQQQGYLPIMFLGILFFLMLVGPGKISVDYFLSLHLIYSDNKSESELEEV